jgi:hypothetical protein
MNLYILGALQSAQISAELRDLPRVVISFSRLIKHVEPDFHIEINPKGMPSTIWVKSPQIYK